MTLTKSNRNATALQVEDLLVNIVGAASTPTTNQSFGSGSATPTQKFACSSLSIDFLGEDEVAKSLIAGESLLLFPHVLVFGKFLCSQSSRMW